MTFQQRTYSLRPLARPDTDSTLEGAFRVYMAVQDMTVQNLATGDFVCIQSESTGKSGIGIAWRATDSVGNSHRSQGNLVLRVSDLLRSSYSFELKDGYSISKWQGQLSTIREITIRPADLSARNKVAYTPKELEYWATTGLISLEAIYVNGTFDVIPRLGAKKMTRQRFLVEKILPDGLGKDAIVPYQFSLESKIVIRDAQSTLDASLPTSPMEFDFGTLKGMDEELDDLAGILESELPHEPTLIVGPSGTGKTSVLKALADGKWSAFRITASTVSSSDSKIRAILSALFSEARDSLPAIVLIDNLDRLVPRDASAALANAIGEEIQNKLNRSVCIVASAKRQLDLHEAFTWVFPNVIELPVPTAAARKDILAVHCESASGELLEHVSLRTHAFVPGDIWRLCGAAKQAARKRRDKAHPRLTSADARPKVQILEEDFAVALRSVRPSAMGEIFLDVPNVRWSDIGGSEHLKDELRRATSFIFEDSGKGTSMFKDKPNCGILMYGPPGCSKTLTAKALATESKFNFFAVKGPELISKYVGDTEYKIREIFRKARAAAPSIIFFDEFDSMAKRDTGHDSLSPVTALLVEMDGVEELSGVIVLAATNRPQVVDKALLRPGRFGQVIYVGPPDLQVRREILDINMRGRPLSNLVDTGELALRTEKWSGAEIAELCNVAAKHAKNEHLEDSTRDKMMPHHFDAALKEITPRISDQMLQDFENWTVSGVEKVVL